MTCWPVDKVDRDTVVGAIDGIDDAVQLSTGLSTGCALRRGGAVACWGLDWTATPRRSSSRAFEVPGLGDAVQVSAGRSHMCAVRAGGEVDCWGDNFESQTGTAHAVAHEVTKPTRVDGIDDGELLRCAGLRLRRAAGAARVRRAP